MGSSQLTAEVLAATERRSSRLSYRLVQWAAATTDAFIILVMSVATGELYHRTVLGISGDMVGEIGLGAIAAAIFVSSSARQRRYSPIELLKLRRQVMKMSLTWFGIFLCFASLAFVLKAGDSFSRISTLAYAASGWAALTFVRVHWCRVVTRALRTGGLSGRKVALVGSPAGVRRLELIANLKRYGCDVVWEAALPSGASPEELQRIVVGAVSSTRGSDLSEIVIVADQTRAEDVVALTQHLRGTPLPVRLIPDGLAATVATRPWAQMGSTIAVEIQSAPLNDFDRMLKRAFDIACAGLGLFMLAPVLILAAIAVKLDSPGPVLFRQTRHGFNGRPFRIYKFRTMSVMEDGTSVTQAVRNDSRVTKIGRFLRRSSVDELPQILNVLRGDMSIVGPRPHAVAHDSHYEKLINSYAIRHHVKPGLTGLAQVNGYRGETPTVDLMAKRVEFDLRYIDGWSLWLDIRIVLRTCVELLRTQRAY